MFVYAKERYRGSKSAIMRWSFFKTLKLIQRLINEITYSLQKHAIALPARAPAAPKKSRFFFGMPSQLRQGAKRMSQVFRPQSTDRLGKRSKNLQKKIEIAQTGGAVAPKWPYQRRSLKEMGKSVVSVGRRPFFKVIQPPALANPRYVTIWSVALFIGHMKRPRRGVLAVPSGPKNEGPTLAFTKWEVDLGATYCFFSYSIYNIYIYYIYSVV